MIHSSAIIKFCKFVGRVNGFSLSKVTQNLSPSELHVIVDNTLAVV